MAIVWCCAIAVDYLSTLVPIHWWQDKTFVLCTFSLEIVNIVQLADAHELWSESTSNGTWKYFKPGISLVPRPPSPSKRKGGSVNIVQHFCTAMNFSSTIWLAGLAIISPVLGFFITNLLAVYTHHTLQTYLLSMPPIYWTHFQDLSIATWCEVVLYLQDPPFLFGGGLVQH